MSTRTTLFASALAVVGAVVGMNAGALAQPVMPPSPARVPPAQPAQQPAATQPQPAAPSASPQQPARSAPAQAYPPAPQQPAQQPAQAYPPAPQQPAQAYPPAPPQQQQRQQRQQQQQQPVQPAQAYPPAPQQSAQPAQQPAQTYPPAPQQSAQPAQQPAQTYPPAPQQQPASSYPRPGRQPASGYPPPQQGYPPPQQGYPPPQQPAPAEPEEPKSMFDDILSKLQVGFQVGTGSLSSDREGFDSDLMGYGIFVRYRFNPRWEAEVSAAVEHAGLSVGRTREFRPITASALAHVFDIRGVDVYGRAGLGRSTEIYDNPMYSPLEYTNIHLHVGVGATYIFRQNIGISAEFRWQTIRRGTETDGQGLNSTGTQLGLAASYLF